MSSTRVVITGTGCITPLGVGVNETWHHLIAGKNAIGPIRSFADVIYPSTFAAVVLNYEPKIRSGRISRCDEKRHVSRCRRRSDRSGGTLSHI